MNVLVTGANGFVGKESVKVLVDEGHQVCPTDIQGIQETKYRSYFMDITNLPEMVRMFRVFKPDVVVHLAALVAGKPSIKKPHPYFRVNILGTLNVLEAMRICGLKKLVFISSWSTYGELSEELLPITEWTPQYPKNPYGTSKVASEFIVRNYAELYGIKTVILRPTMIYGPNQPEKNVIQQLVDSMLTGEIFELYGSGNHTRECLYVTDMAHVISRAIWFLDKPFFEEYPWDIFVIGTGRPYKIKQIAKKAQRISPFELKIIPNSKWAFSQRSNIIKAEKRLGWKPSVTITKGLKLCLEARKNAGS